MKPNMKGIRYEEEALIYLQRKGLQLIARNFHCYFGEVDLIVLDHNQLIFVEVRYRRNADFGSALESIHQGKQRKLKKTAEYFLLKNPRFQRHYIRFDVIAIDHQEVRWIKGGFY